MNAKNFNVLLLIILSVFTYYEDCRGQAMKANKRLVVEYKFKSMLQTNARIEHAIYFIVDSTESITHNNRKFYQFCFSSDSSEITGYLNYSKSSRTVDFIAKDYNSQNPYCESEMIQSVFIFKNSKTNQICDLGEVGSNLNLVSKK
jgi:hypothetical protein